MRMGGSQLRDARRPTCASAATRLARSVPGTAAGAASFWRVGMPAALTILSAYPGPDPRHLIPEQGIQPAGVPVADWGFPTVIHEWIPSSATSIGNATARDTAQNVAATPPRPPSR